MPGPSTPKRGPKGGRAKPRQPSFKNLTTGTPEWMAAWKAADPATQRAMAAWAKFSESRGAPPGPSTPPPAPAAAGEDLNSALDFLTNKEEPLFFPGGAPGGAGGGGGALGALAAAVGGAGAVASRGRKGKGKGPQTAAAKAAATAAAVEAAQHPGKTLDMATSPEDQAIASMEASTEERGAGTKQVAKQTADTLATQGAQGASQFADLTTAKEVDTIQAQLMGAAAKLPAGSAEAANIYKQLAFLETRRDQIEAAGKAPKGAAPAAGAAEAPQAGFSKEEMPGLTAMGGHVTRVVPGEGMRIKFGNEQQRKAFGLFVQNEHPGLTLTPLEGGEVLVSSDKPREEAMEHMGGFLEAMKSGGAPAGKPQTPQQKEQATKGEQEVADALAEAEGTTESEGDEGVGVPPTTTTPKGAPGSEEKLPGETKAEGPSRRESLKKLFTGKNIAIGGGLAGVLGLLSLLKKKTIDEPMEMNDLQHQGKMQMLNMLAQLGVQPGPQDIVQRALSGDLEAMRAAQTAALYPGGMAALTRNPQQEMQQAMQQQMMQLRALQIAEKQAKLGPGEQSFGGG